MFCSNSSGNHFYSEPPPGSSSMARYSAATNGRNVVKMNIPDEVFLGHEDLPATQPDSQDGSFIAELEPSWGCFIPCSRHQDVQCLSMTFKQSRKTVTIGRGPNCTLTILEDCISRLHFSIQCEDDGVVYIEDSSTNGTTVNHEMLERKSLRPLKHGDEIQINGGHKGPFKFVFRNLGHQSNPRVFREYAITHRLGSGAYGTVFKCLGRQNTIVAVKEIAYSAHNKKSRETIAREVQTQLELSHPNIVRLFEVFDEDNTIALVLEYVDGGDLFHHITGHGSVVDEALVQHLMFQLCSGLEYMHEQNIIHRDLKPENILLTQDNPPLCKIADFGLSKVADTFAEFQTCCGTPAYMAPEVFAGQPYDSRVDSWSVGIIMFVMFTGSHMFPLNTSSSESKHFREAYTKPILTLFRNTFGKLLSSNVHNFLGGAHYAGGLLDPVMSRRRQIINALSHPWLTDYSDSPVYGYNSSGELIKLRDLHPIPPTNRISTPFDTCQAKPPSGGFFACVHNFYTKKNAATPAPSPILLPEETRQLYG